MTTRTVERLLDRPAEHENRPSAQIDPLPARTRDERTADSGSVPFRSADRSTRIPSADELNQAQYDVVAATVSRRRSLTDSLQVAFAAAWDLVVVQRDDHLVVRTLPVGPGGPARRFDAPATVSSWLRLIADAHQMRWELPDDQLSLLVSAAFEGLTVDFLASGDPERAREVLRVLAYQVGRYGRRPAKNQQH